MEGIVVVLVVVWVVRLIAKMASVPIRQVNNSMKNGMQNLRDALTENPQFHQQSVFMPTADGKMSMSSFYGRTQSAMPQPQQEPLKTNSEAYEMSGMHVYERVQNRMAVSDRKPFVIESQEGRDPCHDDMGAMKYEDGAAYSNPSGMAPSAFAVPQFKMENLVQAVVMSEILTRPQERVRRRHR